MRSTKPSAAPSLDITTLGYADVTTAAAALGVHHSTVRRLILSRQMPGWRKHRGIWLIRLHVLQQFASTYDPHERRAREWEGRP